MLIDSHCHLDRIDLTPFNNDFSNFMREVDRCGLDHMLSVSIDLNSYPEMRRLVEPYRKVSVSVGVHPNETKSRESTEEEIIALAQDSRVLAIGETGLDYFRSEGDLIWQQERFRRHIRAARQVRKPLIIHMRDASEDTLEILAEEGADEVGGVLHCFTEDWEIARRALDLNLWISFSGIVTFRNAEKIQEAAKKVPQDRFLIETDSPYLAPIPFRGKPNYPYYVRHVAEFIAKLRNTAFENIAEVSSHNFFTLFPEAKTD